MIQRKKRRSEQEWLSIIQECQASDLSIRYEAQEVVPLEIIDDVEVSSNKPAIVLNIQTYRIEISNHAAKETISNTLSVLQQLC